jgi:uncharacterized protein YndB with AHSA1/START domain
MPWFFWAGGAAGGLALIALAVYLVGRRAPGTHLAANGVTLLASPDEVWQAITDFGAQPTWNPLVKAARRLADRDGREAWQEDHTCGNQTFDLITLEAQAPHRLVRAITDPQKLFSGVWEFDLRPTVEGCHVTITERGTIHNAFVRGMVRLMRVDPAATLNQYLEALGRRFREAPAVR